MNHVEHEPSTLTWTTASFGHSADMSVLEKAELSTHLARCRAGSERLILHRAGQSLREFVAAHFVTTSVTIAALALLFRLW